MESLGSQAWRLHALETHVRRKRRGALGTKPAVNGLFRDSVGRPLIGCNGGPCPAVERVSVDLNGFAVSLHGRGSVTCNRDAAGNPRPCFFLALSPGHVASCHLPRTGRSSFYYSVVFSYSLCVVGIPVGCVDRKAGRVCIVQSSSRYSPVFDVDMRLPL